LILDCNVCVSKTFKTAAFNHSAISLSVFYILFFYYIEDLQITKYGLQIKDWNWTLWEK